MTITPYLQRKIDRLRRLAALPPPEPVDKYKARIVEAFLRGMRREEDLEAVMRDFDGVTPPQESP